VFRKVWEMACYSGFLAGREAARLMLHGAAATFLHRRHRVVARGSGYAAFASAKFAVRAVAQAMARELGRTTSMSRTSSSTPAVDTEWVRQRRIEALGPNALDDPDLLMRRPRSRRPIGSLSAAEERPGRLS